MLLLAAGYCRSGKHGRDDPSLLGYLAPRLVASLLASWKRGDVLEAQRIGRLLAPVSSALFKESNPIPVKYALHKMGFIENELRLPLTPASKNTIDIIDAIISSGILPKW